MGAKHVLFLFLDGVGLGANDPQANPFAAAKLPTFEKLLGEARLLAGQAPIESTQATLLPLMPSWVCQACRSQLLVRPHC